MITKQVKQKNIFNSQQNLQTQSKQKLQQIIQKQKNISNNNQQIVRPIKDKQKSFNKEKQHEVKIKQEKKQFHTQKQYFDNLKKLDLQKYQNQIAQSIVIGRIQVAEVSIHLNQNQLKTHPNKFIQKAMKLSELQQQKQLKKLHQISERKNSIIQQLNLLYQQESRLRLLKKQVHLNNIRHYKVALTKSNYQNLDTQTDNQEDEPNNQRLILQTNRNITPLKRRTQKFKTQTNSQTNRGQKEDSIQNNKSKRAQTINEQSLEQKNRNRSYFTTQQKKKIYGILKSRQKRIHKLTQKQKKMLESMEMQRKQMINKQNQKIQTLRQRHRIEIMQKQKQKQLQKLQLRKAYRQRYQNPKTNLHESIQKQQNPFSIHATLDLIQSQEKRHKRQKGSLKKRYIYQQYNQEDKSKEKLRLEKQQILLIQKRQSMKVDFSSIRDHIKQYDQIKARKQLIQKQKVQTFRKQQKQRLKNIREKYGFLTKIKQTILEEQKKSIQKLQQQMNYKLKYQQKMKLYNQSTRNTYDSKQKSRYIQKKQQGLRARTSLSHNNQIQDKQQLHKLERSQSKFKIKKRSNTEFIEKQEDEFIYNQKQNGKIGKQKPKKLNSSPNTDNNIRYTNYLQQMKNSRIKTDQQKQEQIMCILKRQNSSLQQIKKALEMLNSIQREDPKRNSISIKLFKSNKKNTNKK